MACSLGSCKTSSGHRTPAIQRYFRQTARTPAVIARPNCSLSTNCRPGLGFITPPDEPGSQPDVGSVNLDSTSARTPIPYRYRRCPELSAETFLRSLLNVHPSFRVTSIQTLSADLDSCSPQCCIGFVASVSNSDALLCDGKTTQST